MISNRRSFIASLFLTGCILLFLAACDMGASPSSAPTIGPTTATANETSAPVAAATTTSETEQAPAATAVATTGAEPAATPEGAATPTGPQGGTLTIRLSQPVTNLRPWDLRSRGEEHVADLLYNGLVRLDDTLKPQPDLAASWQASEEGRLLTFTLRDNIQWHDGTPLTEADVAWTLNSLRTMTATNALMVDLQGYIADVQTPLSNTVVLSLTEAYAPILADLAVPILPRHLLQERTPEQLADLNFWDLPMGSGPFRFVERNDQGITFSRNDQYVHGAPNLEGVALIVAPDATVATRALNDGTLLAAEFPLTETVSTEPLNDGLQRGAYPENGLYYLAFNVRQERVFSDTRVRQAFALSVDIPLLVQDIGGERAELVVGAISPAAWTYPANAAPAPQDLDRARQLLDDAGWVLGEGETVRSRDGNPLAARIFVRGDDQRRLAAATRIADSAQQIGMQIDVARVDFQTVMIGKLAPPYDFDLLFGSWVNASNSAGYPTTRFYDPDDYALFGASRIWGGADDTRQGLRNIGGFSNPEYEEAALRARATYDPDERAAAIAAAETVIQREVPYLFLWTDRIPVVVSPNVRVDGGDVAVNSPRYLWNVERWYLE